jgi:hypothetical protein
MATPKRADLSVAQRRAIKRKLHEGSMSRTGVAEWAAREFNLPKVPALSTISRIFSATESVPPPPPPRSHPQEEDESNMNCKRRLRVQHPAWDHALHVWYLRAAANGRVADDAIRAAGKDLARLMGLRLDIALSNGWLQSFKRRYDRRDAAGAVPPLLTSAAQKCPPHQIFALHAFRLAPRALPRVRGVIRGVAVDLPLDWGGGMFLTVALASNADGSEKLPPLVCGAAALDEAVDFVAPEGGGECAMAPYRAAADGLLTPTSVVKWLWNLDGKFARSNEAVAVLLERSDAFCIAQAVPLTNTAVSFVPTSPLAAAVAEDFKRRYRALLAQATLKALEAGGGGDAVPPALGRILQLVRDAWGGVPPGLILKEFKQAQVCVGGVDESSGAEVEGGGGEGAAGVEGLEMDEDDLAAISADERSRAATRADEPNDVESAARETMFKWGGGGVKEDEATLDEVELCAATLRRVSRVGSGAEAARAAESAVALCEKISAIMKGAREKGQAGIVS